MKHSAIWSGLKLNNRGQGMLEMALVLPFLIIFFFAVFEFSQLANRHHRVSIVSREAAGTAFKDCVRMTWNTHTGYDACLEDVRSRLTADAAASLPGFDSKGAIIVSLYGYNPNNFFVLERLGMSAESNNFETRYDVDSIDVELLQGGHQVLAYGEVFYKHEMATPLRVLLNIFFPEEIYEASIF